MDPVKRGPDRLERFVAAKLNTPLDRVRRPVGFVNSSQKV